MKKVTQKVILSQKQGTYNPQQVMRQFNHHDHQHFKVSNCLYFLSFKNRKNSRVNHTMQDTDNAFRMIVIKKDTTLTLPTSNEYISDEVIM